ncbi:MAG TPA: condensation domain-containing protein, partial [Dehalococcoidia bacterium]
VEEMLAEIWADVLHVPRVSVTDHFFEVGGHSLLAMQVVSRVRQVFRIELSIRTLFERPTIEGLADAVQETRRRGAAALPPVVPVDRADGLALSYGQERLWFLERLQAGQAVYNVSTALRLDGALDVDALAQALEEIVRRHEVLRTTFAEEAGRPVPVIAPVGSPLALEDLTALAASAREAAVRQRVQAAAAAPFDLSTGPLLRARLLCVAPDAHVLLLDLHHIVCDGWSVGVLFEELAALYAAYRAGEASPLPALAVQYADFAAWQRAQLADVQAAQLAYWRARLAGAPALLALPTDRPRPAVQSYRGAHARAEWPQAVLERLQAVARQEGATLFMVLLGAFQVLLGKYSGSEDVVVGSPIAGRTRKEVEPLIGFFVNTLVLRTDLSGNPSFREVVRRVREGTLAAYEHQDVPFEQLVAELQPARSLSHAPLFQVMCTLQETKRPLPAWAGLWVQLLHGASATTKFDLMGDFAVQADGLRAAFTYSTDLFEAATIERMLTHLGRVLEQVATDPDQSLADLTLLNTAERTQVVETWNQTDATYPADVGLAQLVEAQALRTPAAVAVVDERQTLTYAALNEWANQVAHGLCARGVGPEVRVGICLPRSVEMVVAMLAVLKASGVYVPLDPSYPAERVGFMLADSGMRVLLTEDVMGARLRVPADVTVMTLERARAAAATMNPVPQAGPRHAAYVIYTSGSTGTPKGVVVEHRGLRNLTAWHAQSFAMRAADRVTQLVSAGFDVTAWELWPALTRGACLHVVPDEV